MEKLKLFSGCPSEVDRAMEAWQTANPKIRITSSDLKTETTAIQTTHQGNWIVGYKSFPGSVTTIVTVLVRYMEDALEGSAR